MSDRVSVDRAIAAPADAVWPLISDVTRIGEWSPETVGCEWIGAPTGPEVGARFRGRNRRGKRQWSTVCTVAAATPGEVFAFEVKAGVLKVARWEYRFAPEGEGCRVTETWIDRRGRTIKVLGRVVSGVSDRAEHNRTTMVTTLERLAAAAERAPA
jgi:uncharacterized protein YndB with AHSA1/START domain